ncbi:hypothetical protein BDV19DRAFT_8986 [Aspergillus venezuelensis]
MSSPPMLMLLILISRLLCLSWFLSLLSASSVNISLLCIVLHVLRVCVFDCLKILIFTLIVWLLFFFIFFIFCTCLRCSTLYYK